MTCQFCPNVAWEEAGDTCQACAEEALKVARELKDARDSVERLP